MTPEEFVRILKLSDFELGEVFWVNGVRLKVTAIRGSNFGEVKENGKR